MPLTYLHLNSSVYLLVLLTFIHFLSHATTTQAVGEPPFFLSSCVYFALKDALVAARADAGISGHCRVDAPLTAQRLRMACRDDIANEAEEDIVVLGSF